MCIYVDASRDGLRAWFIENGFAVAHVCDVISDNDPKVLDLVSAKAPKVNKPSKPWHS